MHSDAASAAPALAGMGLWAAFLLGLTGGFGHCLLMCGPFVAATSLAEGSGAGKVRSAGWFQGAYHAGRILTYTLIGLVLGTLGGLGRLTALTQPFSPDEPIRWLKVIAGVSLIVLGIVLLVGALRHRGVRIPEPGAFVAGRAWFRRATAAVIRRGPRWGFVLGMLMGLLPCGPLLPVEIAALASGSPGVGAALMLAFGVGTVPALAGLGAASGLFGATSRGWLSAVTAVLVIALGALVLWQGVYMVAKA